MFLTCENLFACRILHLLTTALQYDEQSLVLSHRDEPQLWTEFERNEDILNLPLMCSTLSSSLFYLFLCALVERDLVINTKQIIDIEEGISISWVDLIAVQISLQRWNGINIIRRKDDRIGNTIQSFHRHEVNHTKKSLKCLMQFKKFRWLKLQRWNYRQKK